MNKRRILFFAIIVLMAIVGSYGYYVFSVRYIKLDERSFYKDTNVELKVVLIRENIPFHYTGNSYSVACQSQNTQDPSNDEYEWKFHRIESGWNRTPSVYLGDGFGTDTNSILRKLSDEAKKVYLVQDQNTLVILSDSDMYVSFDGCRTFKNWILKNSIPQNLLVESTPEYEECLAENRQYHLARDCFYAGLTGKGKPFFQDVTATSDGHASFTVASPSFKDGRPLQVKTDNFGETWNTK